MLKFLIPPTLPGNLQEGVLEAARMTGLQMSEDKIMSPSTPSLCDMAFTSIIILWFPSKRHELPHPAHLTVWTGPNVPHQLEWDTLYSCFTRTLRSLVPLCLTSKLGDSESVSPGIKIVTLFLVLPFIIVFSRNKTSMTITSVLRYRKTLWMR